MARWRAGCQQAPARGEGGAGASLTRPGESSARGVPRALGGHVRRFDAISQGKALQATLIVHDDGRKEWDGIATTGQGPTTSRPRSSRPPRRILRPSRESHFFGASRRCRPLTVDFLTVAAWHPWGEAICRCQELVPQADYAPDWHRQSLSAGLWGGRA